MSPAQQRLFNQQWTPMRVSSTRTAWLTAEGLTPRSAAAERPRGSRPHARTPIPSSAPRWTVYLCFTARTD